jgi:hypothetical protein
MSFNLFESVKTFLSPDLISKAAGFLGESESAVQKGMDVAVPLSLAGIIDKASSGPESLLSLAREANKSGILSNLGNSFSQGGGGIPSIAPGLITSIFGDKFGRIANQLSAFANLKGSTASSLFGAIIPLALATIGKYAADNNVTPGALATLLGSQKKSILNSLPEGFSTAGLLSTSVPVAQVIEKKPTNWIVPIILGILALLLFWYLMKGCNKEPEPVATAANTVVQTKTDTLQF